MPSYKLSYRRYAWPHYRKPGEGEEHSEVFEAEDDESAVLKGVEIKPSMVKFHGHECHRALEQDYEGDFNLSRQIQLPEPPAMVGKNTNSVPLD